MEKERELHEQSVDSLLCLSFSTYSSVQLADIADQVTRDHSRSQNDDSDFEFAAFRKQSNGSVFLEGCAGTVFPMFNCDIAGRISGAAEILFPMEKLVICDDTPSSSSEGDEELDSVPMGTCCVWTPKKVETSRSRWKKSNSTGSTSSKRWKLLEFLRRSRSHGNSKDSLVFLTPSKTTSLGSNSGKHNANAKGKTENSREKRVAGDKVGVDGGEKSVAAFYARKREIRRKTSLPYKQQGFLVGFFGAFPVF